MRLVTIFIYGISAALILVGAIMSIFITGFDSFGKALMFLTLLFTSIYQGWVIEKMYSKLKNKEEKEKDKEN